jgi:transcription antitermination factor NusG
MADYSVYIVICKPSQRKRLIQFLKEHGFEVEPTILNDYIVVFDKDPKDLLKKVFPNVTVEAIDVEHEHYLDILESVQRIRSLAGIFEAGDPVRVIDKESTYYGSTGVVSKIQGDSVEVTLSLWGIPYKVELPRKALMKINQPV